MAKSTHKIELWGIPASIMAILAIGLGISFLMVSAGLPVFPQEKVVKAAPIAPVVVTSQWNVSPAMAKLNESLSKPPAGWEGTGSVITSPQTPYPFSCIADGINPVVSVSKNFNTAGSSIQVVATAYTAGLGAQGMKAKFDKAPSCAGGDAYYTLSILDGLGAESYQANISKTGLNTKTIVWRYGDIVIYLIADPNNYNAYNQAKAFQDNMLAKLSGACLVEDYPETDLARSPFSGVTYAGFYADKKVSIKKLPLPTIPSTVGYKATALPAPATEVQSVELPAKPTNYPVWPLLPTEVAKPVEPKSPSKDVPFEKGIKVKADDTQGPGCGWAFTGSKSPVFDEVVATTYNDAEIAKSEAALQGEAIQWQKDVLAYWASHDKFTKSIPAWNTYVTAVNDTRAAWDKIAEQWNVYNSAKATYDANVKVRDDFIAEQKDAKTKYDGLIEQCKVQDTEDKKKAEDEKKAKEKAEKDKKDNPTATPSATPSPTATPTESPKPRVECPAEKPSILDETAPTVGDAPIPPADPRPADQRG